MNQFMAQHQYMQDLTHGHNLQHIESIRALCAALEGEPMIRSAHINDWGRFSNFEIHVAPEVIDRASVNRIRALINRHIKSANLDCRIRQIFGFGPVYRADHLARRCVRSYERTYCSVDIDFYHYDSSSNSFSK